uniref:Truncated S protein n=1 Tax=Hepatitis B virus TaxID=10407 RepID=A8D2A4_HBV|nr:truncated S protein [Hepatitis B virus]
MENMHQDP